MAGTFKPLARPITTGRIGGAFLMLGGLYVAYGAVTGRLSPMLAALFAPQYLSGASSTTSSSKSSSSGGLSGVLTNAAHVAFPVTNLGG